MHCRHLTSLWYRNLGRGKFLLWYRDEWRTDDAGKTTTAHHTRSETSKKRRILLERERGNLRTFLDRDKTGDMHRRGDSYVEKKIFRSKETWRTHIWDAPSAASKMSPRSRKWKEKKTKCQSTASFFLKMSFSFRAFCEITGKVASINLYREKNSERKRTGNT